MLIKKVMLFSLTPYTKQVLLFHHTHSCLKCFYRILFPLLNYVLLYKLKRKVWEVWLWDIGLLLTLAPPPVFSSPYSPLVSHSLSRLPTSSRSPAPSCPPAPSHTLTPSHTSHLLLSSHSLSPPALFQTSLPVRPPSLALTAPLSLPACLRFLSSPHYFLALILTNFAPLSFCFLLQMYEKLAVA